MSFSQRNHTALGMVKSAITAGDVAYTGASMLPVIGTGMSLWDAGKNLSQGNYMAAAGNVGMAGLTMLPGGGLLKGLGKGLSAVGNYGGKLQAGVKSMFGVAKKAVPPSIGSKSMMQNIGQGFNTASRAFGKAMPGNFIRNAQAGFAKQPLGRAVRNNSGKITAGTLGTAFLAKDHTDNEADAAAEDDASMDGAASMFSNIAQMSGYQPRGSQPMEESFPQY